MHSQSVQAGQATWHSICEIRSDDGMLTNILCLPGLTAAQTAWTDIAWFGFSMGTLFPIILALLGVVAYTVVVGI